MSDIDSVVEELMALAKLKQHGVVKERLAKLDKATNRRFKIAFKEYRETLKATSTAAPERRSSPEVPPAPPPGLPPSAMAAANADRPVRAANCVFWLCVGAGGLCARRRRLYRLSKCPWCVVHVCVSYKNDRLTGVVVVRQGATLVWELAASRVCFCPFSLLCSE